MKLTNKQLKQIIKEELDKILNEEKKEKSNHEKIMNLMSKDIESLRQAISIYESLAGTGAFKDFEEKHLQRLIPYASAVYEFKDLVDKMASIEREIGIENAKRDSTWRALRKKKSAAQSAYRSAQENINQADKQMIAKATDIY